MILDVDGTLVGAAGLRPTRGARRLVLRLIAEGFALVVKSSASERELEALLRVAGIAQLIEDRVAADPADAARSAPGVIERALARLRMAPEEVLLISATPSDLAAAARAGVAAIALRSGGFPDEALEGALAIYDDPQDLVDRLAASPLAERRPGPPELPAG